MPSMSTGSRPFHDVTSESDPTRANSMRKTLYDSRQVHSSISLTVLENWRKSSGNSEDRHLTGVGGTLCQNWYDQKYIHFWSKDSRLEPSRLRCPCNEGSDLPCMVDWAVRVTLVSHRQMLRSLEVPCRHTHLKNLACCWLYSIPAMCRNIACGSQEMRT